MAKQMRLEKEGINYRHDLLVKNDFQKDVEEYSENSDFAKARDDSPWGKGDDITTDPYVLPNENGSKTVMAKTINTKSGGGLYDINGTQGVASAFQGNSGRKWASIINNYNESESYGSNSVDTSKNVTDGQYVVTE